MNVNMLFPKSSQSRSVARAMAVGVVAAGEEKRCDGEIERSGVSGERKVGAE